MKRHSFASHSPEEMRRLSDLGHIVEGVLLAIVGGLALWSNVSGNAWASVIWPILILAAGILLLLLIYPRHPLSDWSAIWRDPQQRQHTLMATALAVAGAAELLWQRTNFVGWRYVWPGGMLFVGVLFLAHTQHGEGHAVSQAVQRHRILGITIVVVGLLRGAEVATGISILALLWPLALMLTAAQLLLYREPLGAFEAGDEHGNQH